MLDELPIEIWKDISEYLEDNDLLNLIEASKKMEFLKSDIIWKDIVKQNWFLTFYDFEFLIYDDTDEYKKCGSYYQLFGKLKFYDNHVIKVIDHMDDLNRDKLDSTQLNLEGIYKKFKYYLPQLMRESRHLKAEDFKEINGRLAITQSQFNAYTKERSTNLRRIYIASKIIKSINSRKFFEFLRFYEVFSDSERPTDYETFYLQFSFCDPLFYDSLLIRDKIINETINEYKSTDFGNNYGSNISKVYTIGKILLKNLKKQSGFIKVDESYTNHSGNSVWLLSRLYMGDFDDPFPLIYLSIGKICSLVGINECISLNSNFIGVQNENKNIYGLIRKKNGFGIVIFRRLANVENNHLIKKWSGKNSPEIHEYEDIFFSYASMDNINTARISKINNSVEYEHMITNNHGRIHSQLLFVGKDIDRELILNITKLVYEKVLLTPTINLFNKCLFKTEIEEKSYEDTFGLSFLYPLEKHRDLISQCLLLGYLDDFTSPLIGTIISTKMSYGVVTNVMSSRWEELGYCVYSTEFGERYIYGDDVVNSRDNIPVLETLLSDDSIGKYFRSYESGKFIGLNPFPCS